DSTNLSLGRYYANISIHTNDPFIETIIVPVILDIVRGHDIIVEGIIADPVLSTAYNNSVGVVIRNSGIYNESGVVVRFLVDDEEMSNITILELASGASETLNFDFIPPEGDHTIKITVDPVPYENYTINNQLTQEFEGVLTPVFTVDPDPGVFHVVEGGLYHFNITVWNKGNANLTWLVTDADEFLSLSPDNGTLQPNGSMDVIITVNASMLVPGEGSYNITFSTNELQGIHVLTIKINVTANTPPVFVMDFPDLTLYIDDPPHTIDLSHSAFDNETPDTVFFEISGWDFYVVNVTLTKGNLLSIYQRWMEGETSLTLRVLDGHGGMDEQVFNISVLYNRPPQLDYGVTFELPDDRTSSVNLLDHVEDEKPEELRWELQYGGTALDLSFNGPLLMVTPENRNSNYSDYVVITVYDLHGKKDITPFNISIIDVNRPPVILPGIEPITIRDDVSNFASVDLGTHGYDPEGDSLYWEIEYDADFFTAVIQGDTLKIMQKEYGSGTADITIILRDPEGKFDSQNISVTIIHVNRKPVLIFGLSFNKTVVDQIMEFDVKVGDIDGVVVKNEWDFDGDGNIDWNSTSTQNASFAYPSPREYTAALHVTDDTGETSTFEFQVKVEEKDTSEKDSPFALVLSIMVIVLLGLIIGFIKFPDTMKSIFGKTPEKMEKTEQLEGASIPKKSGSEKLPITDTRPEPDFSETFFGPEPLKDKPIEKDSSLLTDKSKESIGIETERPPPAQGEREWMPPTSE
ncbi:MAG: hypothetical protein KAU14_09925, partial [Thermoplasmata archaeon]|nr:hypothetical protein [Thermoplasmata archaeon]